MDKKKIEKLAKEIFEFLYENKIWIDVSIYFNHKCWSTHKSNQAVFVGGEHDPYDMFCYNEHGYFESCNIDPKNYFEYVAEPNILSMSFEGPVYDILNGYSSAALYDELLAIFKKYGLYFELGNAWNLSAYII